MRYKLQTGSFAWLIHRVSGVLLTFFIFFHIYSQSPKAPIKSALLIRIINHPVCAILLLLLITAHGLNGLRLTFIDIGAKTAFQKPLFWFAVVAGGIIFVIGIRPLMGGLF